MAAGDPKPALLIVEDDAAALRQLRWSFDDYAVSTARDRPDALEQLRKTRFPVVLLDLGLPPDADGASEGLATLGEILTRAPATKVIVVTGRDERRCALEAVELGAYDFYRKPVDADEIRFLVERARRLYRLEEENQRLARAAKREPLPGVVGTSEAMTHVCTLVEKAAASDISVLLLGETGTGKELLARALHLGSARVRGPFVAINCAAIPEHLLESELFGHERGAFTGAVRQSIGRFELAEGGTLFLDEISDMPLALQAKLLRFLQERLIQRVGGRRNIPIDARIISATHRDLQSLLEEGAFREDLYYRISELAIEIPPLRERPEDVVLLARHFFERYRKEAERPLQGLALDAVAAIVSHPWPGNVRELENRMKRAVVIAEGRRVTARDLDLAAGASEGPRSFALKQTLKEAEHRALVRAWAEADGNVSRVSRLLGVSRPTVYKLLRDHGLDGRLCISSPD
jgi:two-component system NtrC family response regulator